MSKPPKATPRRWMVKSEPASYSYADLAKDGKTAWTGVRNFAARNHLRAMQQGDTVLFYHSVTEKAVVGIARVERTAYADATAEEGDWSCVDLAPAQPLPRPVTLAEIKAHPGLQQMALLRQSRLSVIPVSEDEYREIVRLGGGRP